MYKFIIILSTMILCHGCADTPAWTPGLVVNEMIRLQVANKEVIDNPASGVAADYFGVSGEAVIKAHRAGSGGDKKSISKSITASATGKQK
ncbi:MAG: hypothetical protein COA99_02440 [Moraxellaceae bacterium]|nr:MAG: hypothetical protein COA99_02440 [Moraxellaceae bacterium]